MTSFIKLGVLVIALACIHQTHCSDWKNTVLKMDSSNNAVKKTEFLSKKTREAANGKSNFFKLPSNLVHSSYIQQHHQEPLVPVVPVVPSYQVPVLQHEVHQAVPVVHEIPEHHVEHHHAHHHDHHDHHEHFIHENVIEPFAIEQPVVAANGELVVEQTIGGIPFNCVHLPTGHWRDPNFCDIFHACVHGYQRKSYACPIVGERTYFDEITQKCEFVHHNPHACGGHYSR